MLIKDNSEGSDYEITPAGLHPAVCYGIVDCGTHQEVFAGEPKDRHIMFILFELPTLTIEIQGETKPRGISQKYTKSMHAKANLRIMLENWRSKPFLEAEARQGFDIETIIGKNCQLNIIHNEVGDKTYANIGSVVPLGAGMKKYDVYNPTVCFDILDSQNIPTVIPEWLKTKIVASYEFNAIGQQNHEPSMTYGKGDTSGEYSRREPPPEPEFDDDIPF
jgi:hypothetical protein